MSTEDFKSEKTVEEVRREARRIAGTTAPDTEPLTDDEMEAWMEDVTVEELRKRRN